MQLKDFLEKAVAEVLVYAETNNETYNLVQNDYLEIEGIELTEEILNSNVKYIDVDTIEFMGDSLNIIKVYVN